MAILYIYSSSQSKKIESNDVLYTYSLHYGTMDSPHAVCLNDARRLNAIADRIRDEYAEYIYSFHSLYAERNLVFKSHLNLFFISDIANKRSECFETFVSVCHLMLLKERMKELAVDSIVLDGCSDAFEEAARAYLEKRITVCNRTRSMPWASSLRYLVVQLSFFIGSLAKIFAAKSCVVDSVEKGTKIPTLFFTTYPQNMQEDGTELKYGEMATDTDTRLVALLTDGMHQRLSLKKYLYAIKKVRRIGEKVPIIVLDRWVGIRDVVCSSLWAIRLLLRTKTLYRELQSFHGIRLDLFYRFEIYTSCKRVPRLLMYYNALNAIFSRYAVKEYVYYAFEFCFGRFFTFCLKKQHPAVRRVGFQHGGPISRRKILYSAAQGELSSSCCDVHSIAMPDAVLCEDVYSHRIYHDAGYKNVELMQNIYRLRYLNSLISVPKKGTVLVACGLHDGKYILETVRDGIAKRPDVQFYIKIHPKSNQGVLIRMITQWGLPQVKIADKHLRYYLSFVERVVIADTSVGYEAYTLGITVSLVLLRNKINESPLLDYYEKGDPLIMLWESCAQGNAL